MLLLGTENSAYLALIVKHGFAGGSAVSNLTNEITPEAGNTVNTCGKARGL